MKQIYTLLIVLSMCFLNLYSQGISNKSVGEILDTTGVIKPNSRGSYNAEGYEMTYGKNKAPIFKKIDPPASVQSSTYGWGSVGSGGNGTNGQIMAIAADGSGNIYVGGGFTFVSDIPANYIAKWNGTSWSTLTSGASNGVNSVVDAIAISGNDVYVGGSFTLLGDGTSAKYIAKWSTTTSTWSTLTSGASNGVNSGVLAIAISGSDVYVGGNFTLLGDGSTSANSIAIWNTTSSTWSTLTSGASNGVNYYGTAGSVGAIAISGSDVYVGGNFNVLGDGITYANNIAKWNTTTNIWSKLSNGVSSQVTAIAISGSDVYVGGGFTSLGNGTSAKHIAKWSTTTSTWSTLTSGASNGVNNYVWSIAISGSDIYVGGAFTLLGDGSTSAKYIAKWNTASSTWSTLTSGASNGVNNNVWSIAISGSDVYVGGNFTLLGNGLTFSNHIAKWNTITSIWSTLTSGASNGVSSQVTAIAISGSDVYVGGGFGFLGDETTSANYIAKWNTTTSTWSTLTSGASNGLNSWVYAIAIIGSDVYVGGNFTLLGDGSTSANHIAKWNTTTSTWSTLTSGASNGVNSGVLAIAISGSDVYVGGNFTLLGDGSTSAQGIAKWNTTTNTWSTLPSGASNGVNSGVLAIAISGSDVYVGGNFNVLGDGITYANNIAKWNTTTNTWSTLTFGGGYNGVFGLYGSSVDAIAISGNDVYVGGYFTLLGDGSTSANHIAKWNTTTSTWSTLTSGSSNGLNDQVNVIAVTGSDVYVGGYFTFLGDGTTSANCLAKWNGSNWSALDNSVNGYVVSAMQISPTEGKMYIGGTFTILNGTTFASHIGTFTDPSNPPLPVELLSFVSNVNGRDINLNWSTSTEKNSDKFNIERKTTGTDWGLIGSIKAAVLSNSPKQYSYTDKNLQSGKYQYRLKMIDNDGSFKYSQVVETEVAVPKNYELSQNYPNPFNPNTIISYSLPLASNVKIIIYNSLGQTVKVLENGFKNAGNYSVNFNATELSSGTYFYKIEAGQFSQIKKMMLLK